MITAKEDVVIVAVARKQ